MATDIAGVISPNREFAMTIPMGPIMMSASRGIDNGGIFTGGAVRGAGLHHGGSSGAVCADGVGLKRRTPFFELFNDCLAHPASLTVDNYNLHFFTFQICWSIYYDITILTEMLRKVNLIHKTTGKQWKKQK